MMHRAKLTVVAALLGISSLAHAANTGIDLVANEKPIDTPKSAEAAAKIPANFKFVTPGTLTVAIAVLGSSPPFGTYARDNKTIIGSEADIARLVADGLGLKLKLVPSAWEDWPLGVTSGKYDAAIFNITVTKERKEKFDFATYRQDTLGFYVKSTSSITSIKSAPDIAGKRIIVGSGTNQEAVLLAWDKENQAKGLKPFTPIYVTDNAASSLALQSGRADATFGPNVSAAYQSRLTGNTKLVGIVPGGWPKTANIAVTIKKGNGLVNAVQASLNSAIASGAYIKVLDRWAEASEKIDHSEINPPGLGD
ncbi:ABC transporter substrate-binding protein [Rouxiella badensis]|jgi:polar amino acid transport system substrate-binding protein|uniref:ABC transporter substrate-binding protein n=1 Tax=Rouxiella badensis TaxID=1646377 RepID=A0A1X0WFX4_9GAMM|nr:ABC transporter substrate-binding protein [Rouxiella badensis]MCC3705050.1 ABC transporter substrate-binding protein [Rouxiella badensis]MCC3721067.1 ABC transporter substrate-binding protein [Rouxiella badensis]MCC3730842.1 ABC transporter substrate-binding protein [Rouxiella badensis]MCC3735308.1 ABC transporter substrate-binding protein [Rouxiella badensis]MCC3742632.1 ABC transporter substrate-binding protein [Rouxiella badensis]